MNFKNFRDSVEAQFDKMKRGRLFLTDVSKDDVWERYLDAFPEGTNNIFRTNREYECSLCRRFLKEIGNVVSLNEKGEMQSVWDIKVEGYYQEVADNLATYVKSASVKDVFLHKEKKIGQASSPEVLENGSVKRWNHFSCVLPKEYVKNDVVAIKGQKKIAKEVFKRGVTELSIDAIEIVLDLIAQKSIYRGEEFRIVLKEFQKLHQKYHAIDSEERQNNFLWFNATQRASTLKNSVIGSLVEDLSKGVSINDAVASFERRVAPANYQRTSAPVSKGMVEQAIKKIDELGLETSLYRRFAVTRDVSVNNVLFADRNTSVLMKDSLKTLLMREVKPSQQNYDKVEEIGIDDFIENVLPKVSSVELLLKGRHKSNLVSLIAPKSETTANIFKWDNPFSWSYNGEITDASIKEKVKRAGGDVTGDLRISLSWFNRDDLDIHLKEPDGTKVMFSNKRSQKSTATLDVDMNVHSPVRDAVENITWRNKNNIQKGKHTILVNNYTSRESVDVGCVVEVEYLGQVSTFSYSKKIKDKDTVAIFDFEVRGDSIEFFNINKEVQKGGLSQEIWNIKTEAFHKVTMMMYSPNHWDNNEVGNKHHFFMLENCTNPDNTRGFYNEFLRNDLTPHRKVFELLADKTKCEQSNEQLSGLGFSSTKRDEIICKVEGNFTRVLKIKF